MGITSRLVVGATAMLLLAACGGASGAARPPSSATPPPSPSPSPSPAPTPDLGALVAAVAGTYAGTWTNTTFNSTGPVTAVLSLDRATLTVTAALTVGGSVFGGQPPPPESFSGKLGELGSIGFSGHSPTFGDFTVTATGPVFVMKAQNLANGRVDHFEADGAFTGTTISGTYKAFLKDGTTADGVFSLTRS